MAIAATIAWEVRNTADYAGASDNNGGGFKPGASGTDYSYASIPADGSPQKSGSDLVAKTATQNQVRPTAAGVAAADVGNVIQITNANGGGWTTGFYEIQSQDGTYWTLDRNATSTPGDAVGATYAMGGALASPGKAAAAYSSGHDVWIKYSTTPYSVTTTSTNVAAGCVLLSTAGVSANNPSLWEGYESTRTDRGKAPKIQASGLTGTYNLLKVSGASVMVTNIWCDVNNVGTNGTCFNGSATTMFDLCIGTGANGTGYAFDCGTTGSGAPACRRSIATSNTGAGGFYGNYTSFEQCIAYDNNFASGKPGFNCGSYTACINCLSYRNDGTNNDGFQVASAGVSFINCLAYHNSRHGFNTQYSAIISLINCISVGNGSWQFCGLQTDLRTFLVNCAADTSGSGTYDTSYWAANQLINFTSLGANYPFTTASGTAAVQGNAVDFTLVGGSAACQVARTISNASGLSGLPTSTTYFDIGPTQHRDRAVLTGVRVLGRAGPARRQRR